MILAKSNKQIKSARQKLEKRDRAGTDSMRKNSKPPQLPATDLEIRQQLIFSSFGLELLIYNFKKLISPSNSFFQIAR